MHLLGYCLLTLRNFTWQFWVLLVAAILLTSVK
jgi:hypothetical protein